MHFARIIVCSLLIVLVHGGCDWYSNLPQDAGTDVPSGKLTSLSFAPFREGFSPLEKKYPLPEHVDEDLSLLADKTYNVRTYSSLGGMQPVPDMARKYGLTVLQGAWIGDEDLNNRQEVAELIKSANANPDVVKRVIVGNEVLLRGEMNVDRLITYIREVKKAVKQPVSYADVWSMYMKYPQLIKEVDFITIHILPYWEDEPISVDHATEHLEKIVKQVEDEARGIAPDKTILIGESGWPGAGRQRGLAKPSVVNEAKFIRGMIAVTNRHGFDYNIVEAFDQPWKSHLEGVVGANWGLLSADRQPVFPLNGPVQENPSWLTDFFVASVLWLLIIIVYVPKMQSLSWLKVLLFLGLAQVFSVALVGLAKFDWYTSYSHFQRTYTAVLVLANAGLGWLLLRRYLQQLTNAKGNEELAGWLRRGYLFFIALALFKTLSLAVRGRYLSFPVEQFMLPALGVLGLMASQWLGAGRLKLAQLNFDQLIGWRLQSQRDHWIGYMLIFGMMALVLGETNAFLQGRDFIQAHPRLVEGLPVALEYTLYNQQLVNWLLCLLVLSLPFWRKHTENN